MLITYLELVLVLPIKFHLNLSTICDFQEFRFPRLLFPPPTPYVPGFDSKRKWSIWEIRPFYISSSIKIRSPIRKIKKPKFSRFPRISVSPSNSPQCHWIWSWFLNKISEEKDPSKYQISFRSDHPFVSYKCLIFTNFSQLPPSPTSPKESGSGPVVSVPYLGLFLILPTKLHPDLSTLSVFPPMTLDLVENWKRDLSYKVLLNMKFH